MPAQGPRAPDELIIPGRPRPNAQLPSVLAAAAQRGASGAQAGDEFVNDSVVSVVADYEMTGPLRGQGLASAAPFDGQELYALEAEDGTTVFVRADRLREMLADLYPEEVSLEGDLDLGVLRDRSAATRGVSDWLWARVSRLVLRPDALIEKARERAQDWVVEKLGEAVQERLESLVAFTASTYGAKALMWAIESRLPGGPGLYPWTDGTALAPSARLEPGDQRLAEAADAGPLLVFVHGTASETVGSFGDLAGHQGYWQRLQKHFRGRVYGFEHRTFSESPVENAIALLDTLPAGARVCLVTHSRGGLVGDLVTLAALDEGAIAQYEHNRRQQYARRDEVANEHPSPELAQLRDASIEDELANLRRLSQLIRDKHIHVQRYLRVACPARGTALLSDNLEVFLSGVLSLMTSAVGLVTSPVAAPLLSAFKRVVLEVADKRLDPHLVPGIEAMLTDAPLGELLLKAPRQAETDMAVIAGDVEGGHLLKRIAVLFTDWMLFDGDANDLVVDTDSMLAGIARVSPTHYLFSQGPRVNHFRYFLNETTRQALLQWMTTKKVAQARHFAELSTMREPSPTVERSAAAPPTPSAGERPVVILLPGIMGSHLERVSNPDSPPGLGDRIWFDFFDIARGGMGDLGWSPAQTDVRADALFERYYGELADTLARRHTVIRHPYDWRRPVQELGDDLARVVGDALDTHPGQPVRLLVHSMGGLVARAMIAQHEGLWRRLLAHPGSPLVMMGTPNNGSHAMVETLLGKASTVRHLARLDLRRGMGGLLEIIAGFPGAVALLPRPEVKDLGPTQANYLEPSLWRDTFRAASADRWFGRGHVGVPSDAALDHAREMWEILGRPIEQLERIAYVYGKAERTPAGVRLQGGRLRMVGTTQGDGSVSWTLSKLAGLPDSREWLMPVEHGRLASVKAHFTALEELLVSGTTQRLARLPALRGREIPQPYDAPPPAYPTEQEVLAALVGATPAPLPARSDRRQLTMRVRGMDLRNSLVPVMCGHYLDDPIAGPQRHIDRYLVHGALAQRANLNLYPGELRSSAAVLMTRTEAERKRGTQRGALIVGLGEYGELTTRDLTETVRAGVLRLLLQQSELDARDQGDQADVDRPAPGLKLASLLVGHNSTTNITPQGSIDAITLGVCQANEEFSRNSGPRAARVVTDLTFLELYVDVAITAAYALRGTPERLRSQLGELEVEVLPAQELVRDVGLTHRLRADPDSGYWPRVVIESIADRKDQSRPTSFRFLYLSERARAESKPEQYQPELIMRLVKRTITQTQYQPDLARLLFQLMVPVDLKSVARHADRMVLVVDEHTAALPWEMMQADQEPSVGRTTIIRQLATGRSHVVRDGRVGKRALVIAEPSTDHFVEYFDEAEVQGLPKRERGALPALPGAAQEGGEVAQRLRGQHYEVTHAPPESTALQVLSSLYDGYRVLVICAHGLVDARTREGELRTGVVLSDGLVLTATEIRKMEVVPELVFLNCCHLGTMQVKSASPNYLAYGIAQQFIEMGARCVVAAGWAVQDDAARLFANSFFETFLGGSTFGEAIRQARVTTLRDFPGTNTWGAYQAYGDPDFKIEPESNRARPDGDAGPPVAPEEVVQRLRRWRPKGNLSAVDEEEAFSSAKAKVESLLHEVPTSWQDDPSILVEIGQLYASCGMAGASAAAEALARALRADDPDWSAPVRAIETLANLESRLAERSPKGALTHARELLKRSQLRLDSLEDAVTPWTEHKAERGSALPPSNQERGGLLAKVYKVKAQLWLRSSNRNVSRIRRELERSRDAYRAAQEDLSTAQASTYAAVNYLHLEAVLREREDQEVPSLIALAERCREVSHARTVTTYDFHDSVGEANAWLAIALLRGELDEEQALQMFQDAVVAVPSTLRERDSLIVQLRTLAEFLEALAAQSTRDRAGEARVLLAVAARLAPESGEDEAT